MSGNASRGIPFLPIALVLAAVFLVALFLILDTDEAWRMQVAKIQALVIGFAICITIAAVLGVGRRAHGGGYHSDRAAERLATEMTFTGDVWADTSTYRRPRRIRLDRKEVRAWKEAAEAAGLTFEHGRNPRISGTLRGVEVRVDPFRSRGFETRARAALPVSLSGKVTAVPDGRGSVVIEGAPADLEAALRDGPTARWLAASEDASLEIGAQGTRAFVPDILNEPDRLRGLMEIAVSAAEAVSHWLDGRS